MENPFLSVSDTDQSEYLTSRCSLNRAVLAKLPLYGIEDEIEGLRFKEIFSTPLITAEIRRVSRRYAIDLSDIPDENLPRILDEALLSNDVRCKQMAERVVRRFGCRLGLLLLALRTGERENRLARPDWDDRCWQYWHEVGTVILTGGLASSMLGRRFKEYIHMIFDMAGVRPYHIMLFDNGRYLGVMGLAQRLMADDTASLVLDLGQTNFKRALVKKAGGQISEFIPMETLPSSYMENRFDDEEEQRRVALLLHKYIVNTVAASYREAAAAADGLSDTVLISIASYTHNGILDNERGGYAKLSALGTNYARLLAEELSGELHRRVHVRLVHDGTATALYFSDVDNAVCVTLGTAFGVGFPEIRI